jgi:WD40 repeat protein
VFSVEFSPDGQTLAICGWERTEPFLPGAPPRTIRLRHLTTGQDTTLSHSPGGRDDCYGFAVAFHPSGRTLASSGGMNGTAYLWDLDTGHHTVLTGHTSGVNAVTFSPDGRTLATASADTTVRLWDTATGQTTATLTPQAHYVQSVCFSPDGRILASRSVDATVRLWNVATGQPTTILFDQNQPGESHMAFSPDGSMLAGSGNDGMVRLWQVG